MGGRPLDERHGTVRDLPQVTQSTCGRWKICTQPASSRSHGSNNCTIFPCNMVMVVKIPHCSTCPDGVLISGGTALTVCRSQALGVKSRCAGVWVVATP